MAAWCWRTYPSPHPPPSNLGVQAYIDADNAALEREQRFAAKEIVVRMEYKHCPNLTIIDTPGA